MDDREKSRIINSDILGPPNKRKYWPTEKADEALHSHVRILTNSEDLLAYCRADDDIIEPPDAWDETTDTQRNCEVTIGFDARTELEADLAVTAITEFVKRRLTSLEHPVFTARLP